IDETVADDVRTRPAFRGHAEEPSEARIALGPVAAQRVAQRQASVFRERNADAEPAAEAGLLKDGCRTVVSVEEEIDAARKVADEEIRLAEADFAQLPPSAHRQAQAQELAAAHQVALRHAEFADDVFRGREAGAQRKL